MSRSPNPPPAEDADRIRRALQARDDAVTEVAAAVAAAVRNGGSIRTVAELADVSTSTVQRWVQNAS